jgi:S-adenosylmethionine synthetase
VNTFGTGKISDEKLESYILENFDMRPKALIDELGLKRPIYRATSAYGHFGRAEFPWEKTDRAEAIAADLLGGGKAKGKSVTNGHANGVKETPKNKKKTKAIGAEA